MRSHARRPTPQTQNSRPPWRWPAVLVHADTAPSCRGRAPQLIGGPFRPRLSMLARQHPRESTEFATEPRTSCRRLRPDNLVGSSCTGCKYWLLGAFHVPQNTPLRVHHAQSDVLDKSAIRTRSHAIEHSPSSCCRAVHIPLTTGVLETEIAPWFSITCDLIGNIGNQLHADSAIWSVNGYAALERTTYLLDFDCLDLPRGITHRSEGEYD